MAKRILVRRGKETWKYEGIMNHPSFHGTMTGTDAESKLAEKGGNYYLTRYSTSRKQYLLTVTKDGVSAHFAIIITRHHDHSLFEIDGTEMLCKCIFSLLKYYKSRPLIPSISGIGEPLLTKPIIDKPLEEVYPKLSKPVGEQAYVDLSSPNLNNLLCFPYTNMNGTNAKIMIMAQLTKEWYRMGLMLGQPAYQLENARVQLAIDAGNYKFCRHVFYEWIKNPAESKYPVTWNGVIKLLRDIECGELATKLQVALASNGIKI